MPGRRKGTHTGNTILRTTKSTQETDLIELPFAVRVSCLIEMVFGGEHRLAKRTEHATHVELVPHGTLATYDDDRLTWLVLAAHKYGVRAEVTNNGMRGLKILLHNRKARTGRMFERHPTIEDVLGHEVQTAARRGNSE